MLGCRAENLALDKPKFTTRTRFYSVYVPYHQKRQKSLSDKKLICFIFYLLT